MKPKTPSKLMITLNRLQPLIALLVLVVLVILCVNLLKYNNLQEQINVNCGWEEEHGDFKCFYKCDKTSYFAYIDELNGSVELDIKDRVVWD